MQVTPLELIILPTSQQGQILSLSYGIVFRTKKVQLVHIRGTPASGKSTLANSPKTHIKHRALICMLGVSDGLTISVAVTRIRPTTIY